MKIEHCTIQDRHDDDRLSAWCNGELEDIELTMHEIRTLEKRVFDAVTSRILQRSDVYSFGEHFTIQ